MFREGTLREVSVYESTFSVRDAGEGPAKRSAFKDSDQYGLNPFPWAYVSVQYHGFRPWFSKVGCRKSDQGKSPPS